MNVGLLEDFEGDVDAFPTDQCFEVGFGCFCQVDICGDVSFFVLKALHHDIKTLVSKCQIPFPHVMTLTRGKAEPMVGGASKLIADWD